MILLLIEPIWNRNEHNQLSGLANADLLIEPIWNRNARTEEDRNDR